VIELVETPQALREALGRVRAKGGRVGLVPTMGALHEGHRALLAAAAATCDATVVSVFVNPLQFDDAEDLARYPRSLESDLRLAEAAGACLCFAPEVATMYPAGRPQVVVDPGRLALELEGASRPGHFLGVATVVTKLLAMAAPDAVFFGEKDYQQLVIVRRLVADLSFSAQVVGVETVREPDGLAMSSRNQHLSPRARAAAPVLYQALDAGRRELQGGGTVSAAARAMAAAFLDAPLVELDYAVVRDASDLGEVHDGLPTGELRLLVAAKVGGVRLIDNLGFSR
jgi:pantoate--beta-alanine ligase